MGKIENGTVTQSEESMTRMTSYRPSIIMMPYRIPSFRAGARMLCGQTGNRIVPLSEESMTLMTPYRLPHHGNRSFAAAQDDVLPFLVIMTLFL